MDFKEQRHFEVDSTQRLALKAAKSDQNPNGLVIIAEKQLKGEGRKGRKWESPLGGLYLSVVIKKKLPIKYFQGFSIRFGLELVKNLEMTTELPFRVKWPNDLIVNNKKIGGIMIDINSQNEILDYLVVGIGFNVNISMKNLPDEISRIATSILEEKNNRYSIKIIKDEILNSIRTIINSFEKGIISDMKEPWKKYSYSYEKIIKTEALGNLEGIESGITDEGDLLINIANEKKKISIGDVWLSQQ